jgi:hypothetical protein
MWALRPRRKAEQLERPDAHRGSNERADPEESITRELRSFHGEAKYMDERKESEEDAGRHDVSFHRVLLA